jgi:upstream activation factor subunit UAF30
MARTTKATTAKSETAPAPVVDSAAVAAPVVEKAVKAKKAKAPKQEAAPVTPAPVESAPVDADAAVDGVDGDVAPVAEKSIEFLAKLQQLGALLSTLKSEYRALEKQWTRELKSAQKQSSKRKRKAGNRAPSGFVKPTRISDELASFLEKPAGTEMARTEVTREINVYIRNHNLQDKANGRKINPDKPLTQLLKVSDNVELTYFNLQKYMGPHFPKAVKAEPVASA